MKLSNAQSSFKRHTFAGEADSEALKNFKPGGKMNLQEAFEVYHGAYIARLSEALRETFEATHWVLGDAIFDEACRNYIETQPSVSYNLSDYGNNFPEFLRAHPTLKGIPFSFDLARFEWRFKELFHAQNPDPLSLERVQELIHAENFKVSFIEAMDLFASPYAIYDLWSHRKEPHYEFEDINWELPENLLLYKKDQKIYVKRIDDIELQILQKLREGQSVTEAFAGHSDILSPDKIVQFFQMMMKAGIIDDIREL